METLKSSYTLLLPLSAATAAAHTDVDLFCCLFNSGCNGVVYSTTQEYLSKHPLWPVAEQEIIRLTTKAKMNSVAAVETG